MEAASAVNARHIQNGSVKEVDKGSCTSAPRTAASEFPQPPQPEDKQVMGFKTMAELEKHTCQLGLKRIMIIDLPNHCDLSNGYIGGWVIASHAEPYSQGHDTTIFVRDESTTDEEEDAKILMVNIAGDIVQEMPALTSSDFKLFIHQGDIVGQMVEFSQDLANHINVRGSEPRVWIVHKNAKKPGFFQQQSCKPAWFRKQKKRREKLAKSAETSEQEAQLSHDKDQDPQQGTPSDSDPDPHAHDYSLPDDFGFPDSAFNEDFSFDQRVVSETSTASSSDSEDSSSAESSEEWYPKAVKQGNTGRKYAYKKLADIKHGDKKINVFGVVKHFTGVVQTRGTDLCSMMVLVDESNPLIGVKCVNFSRSEDKLPRIRRVGDVVSLHRVFADRYQSQVQLVNNAFSSFQRFSGRVGSSFRAHTGSLSYTFTREDKERVKELRLWYLNRNRVLCRTLEDISPDTPFGLLCQVVAVAQPEELDCVVLSVWDGTKCPLTLTKRIIAKEHQAVLKSSPALSAVAFDFEHQIVVYDKQLFQAATSLNPGGMVLIENVKATICEDLFELQVNTSQEAQNFTYENYRSSIEVLHQDDNAHDGVEKALQEAAASQATVTSTPHQDAPLVTLAELQAYSTIPVKAHCRVKVLGVLTASLEDMVRLTCDQCDLLTPILPDMDIDENGVSKNLCSDCVEAGQILSESPNPHCTYLFVLKVTDLTGTVLNFHVANDEALALLNDANPTSFYQHQQARYQLLHKLCTLTGDNLPFKCDITEHPRPWIDCCAIKVRHGEKNFYFMFDTTLVCDANSASVDC